jgi:hypothetical protein
VQHVAQDLDHLRVVAPDREHAPAGEQVEIAVALRVEEVLPARLGVRDVVADRLQHLHDLPIQILVVQRVLLGQTLGDQIQNLHAAPPLTTASIAANPGRR